MSSETPVALVVGASRGLGRDIALWLARQHAHCVLLARSQKDLEETEDAIKAQGSSAVSLAVMDVTDAGALAVVTQRIAERFGRLDGLVYNVGCQPPLMPIDQLSVDDWQRAFNVNVTAAWHCIKALTPLLLASSDARAVFVTCREAQKQPYWGGLAASKGALEAMVLSWAAEHSRDSLRVNLFDPGPLLSEARSASGASLQGAKKAIDVIEALKPLLEKGGTQRGTIVQAQKS
ncbi:MAG: SDR family NAD(P)-dependent oxidoreductase [Alphaproteobacteria bacterium GM202ARS2]|nr:SDR family NAD(P)-dependent oxidoreductase [Alphaproteobacteria bacterium GM202ARS2]